MSLVTTLMQPLRTKYVAKTLDKNEIRASRYGAWDFFQQQSKLENGILTDQAKEFIKKSAGQLVDIPVLNAENVTISNVRSCVIPAGDETSALVRITFVTYAFGFTMNRARHANNDVSYQQLFNKKLEEYLLKLAATLDTAAANKLNTDRNVYFPAEITNFYPVVANSLQVPLAKKNDFFNQLEAILMTMDYYGQSNVIGSTTLLPMIKRLYAQGKANEINQSFQFDPYKWFTSNRITNAATIGETMYAVPDGYVAVANRNMPDNIMKHTIGPKDSPLYAWDEQFMPIVNLNMGTFYTQNCADMSALDGGGARMTQLQRTAVEGFAFDTDVAYITAYNSAPASRYSPILKAEISNVVV